MVRQKTESHAISIGGGPGSTLLTGKSSLEIYKVVERQVMIYGVDLVGGGETRHERFGEEESAWSY